MDCPPSDFSGKDPLERNPAPLLVVPTLSLLLGQAAFPLSFRIALICSSAVLIASVCTWLLGKRKWALLFFFSSLAFFTGHGLHQRALTPQFPNHHLRLLTDGRKAVQVEGFLYREPERQFGRSRWYLRTEVIWRPLGAQEAMGNILVTVREVQREWHYGDRVRLWVRVRPPRPARNPGEFDYGAYLARRGIYLTGFLGDDGGVELLHRDNKGAWKWIQHLRREIRSFIDRNLPPGEAGLLKALVIGDRGGLSRETRERFAAAGVAHVLSISGLHVGMLGLVAFIVVRFLGSLSSTLMLRWNLFKIATFLSFVAVLFYAALAGGRIPTVRAAIMVGVYVLAVLFDREEEFYISLALAALLIGLIWPGVVMDTSFQLSFLAVLFIVWGLRRIQQLRELIPRDNLPQTQSWLQRRVPQIALYLAVPVLATLGTGPVVTFHFGRLSLAGFLANPILVPIVGFVVVPLGFLIGFLCLFSTALALPLLWVAKPLLSLTLWMVGLFSELPMGVVNLPRPNLLELGIVYLLICSVLVLQRRTHVYLLLVFLLVAVVADGAYWWRQRWGRRDLRITYLSVGHGDAAVVEFPGSSVLLIDAGGSSFPQYDPGRSIVAPFLRSRRIAKVDYVLVSHPRIDHYGGMKSILEEFAPLEFWSGPVGGGTRRYLELEATAKQLGVKRVVLNRSNSCQGIGGVQICVLYPSSGVGDDSSVVLRLTLGQYHFLFPGDIRKKDEKSLVGLETEIASQVLKVPRHGSLTANTNLFVSAVRPRLAIFSIGYRSPRAEVIARYHDAGSEILRTDQDGAIIVETNGERLSYRTHLSGKRGRIP